MTPDRALLLKRAFAALGAIGLAVWAFWWGDAITYFELYFGKKTWLQYPMFGADFWSQPEYAARLWLSGRDPYVSRGHLFHYPPLAIRLFLWVGLFSPPTALRIWVITLIAIVVAGTVVAHRTRGKLGLESPPLTLSLLAVLVSFPIVFQLERSNFDLLTLAALLAALPLFARERAAMDFAGGCLLAIGPWVKLYPGLMGFGLVALRRKWAALGFVVAGVVIGLLTPVETRDSFEVLGVQVGRVRAMAKIANIPQWSHSISAAWLYLVHSSKGPFSTLLQRIPEGIVAGGLVVGGISLVCFQLFRYRAGNTLLYPLLLWICAAASCAPVIANDYSLAFYPIAVVACSSLRDPWAAKLGILASLVWWQPFLLPIPAWPLLLVKLAGVAAVGVSLVERARESRGS